MRHSTGSWTVLLLAAPVLGALLFAPAGAARAEDPPTPVQPAAPEKGPAPTAVPERLAVEMQLTAFVEMVARKTGASFTWDPQSKMLRDRQVSLTRDLLRDESLGLPLLRRVLSTYEQALVPMGDPARPLYAILDARTGGVLMRLKPEVVTIDDTSVARLDAMDGVFVTTTLHVPGLASLRDLRAAVQRIATGNNIGNVNEVPDADVLVVTDFAPTVAAIYRTVRQALQAHAQAPPANQRVTTVALKHARSPELASLLTRTFETATPTPTPAQAQAGSLVVDRGPRILADERTNQLVIAGTPGEMQAVMAVVAALDVPAPMR
jgi:hypothetical protein